MDPVSAWNFDAVPCVDYFGPRTFTPTGNTTAAGGKLTQIAAETFDPNVDMTGLNTPTWTWMADVAILAGFTGWVGELNRSAEGTGVRGLLFLSGSLRFRAKDASNTAYEVGLPNATGTERHLTATHDGSTLRLYINGTLHGSTPMAQPAWAADDIAFLDNCGSGATLDNFRLFNAALTQPEIDALVGVPVAEPAPPATGRLKYESAPGVWTPVQLKTETGTLLTVKTETAPGTWEALP